MINIIKQIKNRFYRTMSYDIDYETLKNMKNKNDNVWIIDVRANDEYLTKHIEGAINIPLQDIDKKLKSLIINKQDIIIMYCEYGGRSKKAYMKLKKAGYLNVYNLKNGIDGILGTPSEITKGGRVATHIKIKNVSKLRSQSIKYFHNQKSQMKYTHLTFLLIQTFYSDYLVGPHLIHIFYFYVCSNPSFPL